MLINKFQAFKRERFVISMLLFLISLAFYIFSYTIYSQPKLEPSFEDKRADDMAKCKRFAEYKGYTVRNIGRSNLELTDPALDLDVNTFVHVESIFLACDNLEPQMFCMGIKEYCGQVGKKMVLSYAEPESY